jgi:hypothetical protein
MDDIDIDASRFLVKFQSERAGLFAAAKRLFDAINEAQRKGFLLTVGG